jgi:predicted enzyme related to lactoylglutathione lyase
VTDPSRKHGSFCWNDVTTNDPEASKTFYTQLFGWSAHDTDLEGMTYTIFRLDGSDIAGMLTITPEWGDTLPYWMPHIAVDDVDASVKRATDLGAEVVVPPSDLPTIGRYAIITDPVGAAISLIKLTRQP